MIKNIAALMLLMPSLLWANSCDLLLQQGINNITRYQGAGHARAFKWHSVCRVDQSKSSDAALGHADGTIFGYGQGSFTLTAAQQRSRVLDFCRINTQFGEDNFELYTEAQLLSTPAFNAWSQCNALAKNGIQIATTSNGAHSQLLRFTMTSSVVGDEKFAEISAEGFSCSKQQAFNSDAGNDSGINTMRVDCRRNKPTHSTAHGKGRLTYALADISINTPVGSLLLSFPEVVEDYYATPPGSILPMMVDHCPAGWLPYLPAVGRMLLGSGNLAGSDENIAVRSSGGSANHSHTGETMRQEHGYRRPGDNGDDFVASKPGHRHAFITEEGRNIPPYTAVKFCYRPIAGNG